MAFRENNAATKPLTVTLHGEDGRNVSGVPLTFLAADSGLLKNILQFHASTSRGENSDNSDNCQDLKKIPEVEKAVSNQRLEVRLKSFRGLQ